MDFWPSDHSRVAIGVFCAFRKFYELRRLLENLPEQTTEWYLPMFQWNLSKTSSATHEAAGYIIVFLILWYVLLEDRQTKIPRVYFFSLFLILRLDGSIHCRIFKKSQEGFADGGNALLSTGQWLIPSLFPKSIYWLRLPKEKIEKNYRGLILAKRRMKNNKIPHFLRRKELILKKASNDSIFGKSGHWNCWYRLRNTNWIDVPKKRNPTAGCFFIFPERTCATFTWKIPNFLWTLFTWTLPWK